MCGAAGNSVLQKGSRHPVQRLSVGRFVCLGHKKKAVLFSRLVALFSMERCSGGAGKGVGSLGTRDTRAKSTGKFLESCSLVMNELLK